MAIEIERKFLARHIPTDCTRSLHIWQGYLQAAPERTIRVRISEERQREPIAHLAIKGASQPGHFTRQEFEYEIPLPDARALLEMCDHKPIEKIRYHYPLGNHLWEIDEFRGANQGLVVAEIELQDESSQFELPAFIGEEVTQDARYLNLNLAYRPFTTWPV